MMRLEHSADIGQSLQNVYARARAVERYPEFLPGYVTSRIVDGDREQALIERQARVRGKLHTWRSRVRFRDNRSIHFQHVNGPLEGMRVHWQFAALAEGRTRLSIIHEIQVKRPFPINKVLERWIYGPKVGELAAQVVAAFKQACESKEKLS